MNVCGPVNAGRHSRPHFMKCFLLGEWREGAPCGGRTPLPNPKCSGLLLGVGQGRAPQGWSDVSTRLRPGQAS